MIPIDEGNENIGGKFIQFPGPVITWVGEMPWIDGFAYGDEEGGLRFTSTDGLTIGTFKAIKSDRSINQVAFSERDGFRYIAVCTASDIAIHRFTEGGDLLISKAYDWGGHGIYSTRSGGFLVPMGPVGLAVLTPRADGEIEEAVFTDSKNIKYFYTMSRIASSDRGEELWACAGRSDGLMAITLDGNRVRRQPRSMQSIYKPKDYVHACSIGNNEMPLATVSLSRNGEVDFFVDLLKDKTPLTWHFQHEQGIGTAYSLATACGHIFIITSNGIYICQDIVDRFLRGELEVGVEMVTVRHLPLEAIDFALAYKTWMMVLLDDKIVRLHLKDMISPGHFIEIDESGEQLRSDGAPDSESHWTNLVLRSAVRRLAVA